MRNLRLTLSYDGSDFHGWQTQPGLRTVQETLELALADFTGEERVRVNASGRTDAGVHAVGQVVNFHTVAKYPPAVFVQAVNARLPEDIVIASAEEVAEDFDANCHAVRKMYRYVINTAPTPNLFMRHYCWFTRKSLDVEAMRAAAEPLKGKHDFHSFETHWPNRTTSVRTITHLAVNRVGEWVWVDVEADGFLYNMVRAITGTLMYVGTGYWPVEEVARILSAEDRTQAGPNAPPQGLFLMRVIYDD